MKLYTFIHNGKEKTGLYDAGGKLYAIGGFSCMNELIAHADSTAMESLESEALKTHEDSLTFGEVELLAPIPHPMQDVLCLGFNYAKHAEESARYKPDSFGGEQPKAVYFSKRVNEALPDRHFIDSHPELVERLDYETELAVIIGRDAKNVPAKNVRDYIFGYTIVNDVSARNVQTERRQWYFGKSLDTFTPMGPCIVTARDIAYPPALKIQTRINAELRQDSTTDMLIHDIDQIVSELSAGMTLKAGTIIATGTPAGVGMGMEPPCFLKHGDVVECHIEKIGTLTNTVM